MLLFKLIKLERIHCLFLCWGDLWRLISRVRFKLLQFNISSAIIQVSLLEVRLSIRNGFEKDREVVEPFDFREFRIIYDIYFLYIKGLEVLKIMISFNWKCHSSQSKIFIYLRLHKFWFNHIIIEKTNWDFIILPMILIWIWGIKNDSLKKSQG